MSGALEVHVLVSGCIVRPLVSRAAAGAKWEAMGFRAARLRTG